jgi:predicted dinucleotide-binding enzyme
MKIGILGSGDVGRSLGRGFAGKGHDVRIGSRNPGKPEIKEWLRRTKGKVSAGTFADAAAHGEVVLLCTLGQATDKAIDLAGPENFSGKVLIDVTVPLDFSKGMPPGLYVGVTDSLGEQVQRKLPKAKVVKCFNIVNNQTMVNPRMKEGVPDMMICGNDPAAKETVAGFLKDFGWGDPIDLGGIENARWLEALVPLWVRVGGTLGSWAIAFKVLRS